MSSCAPLSSWTRYCQINHCTGAIITEACMSRALLNVNTIYAILLLHSHKSVPAAINMGLEAAESQPAGSHQPWFWWRSLNRMLTGIGCVKTTMMSWATLTTHSQSTAIVANHLLCCQPLAEPCSPKKKKKNVYLAK